MVGFAMYTMCFDGETSDIFGLDYNHGTKAWVNTGISCCCLHRFDNFFGNTSRRKVLILVDNTSLQAKSKS